jgi:hypothetical protein
LHLKVLEPRAREMFLNTVLRLFLGEFRLIHQSCVADDMIYVQNRRVHQSLP